MFLLDLEGGAPARDLTGSLAPLSVDGTSLRVGTRGPSRELFVQSLKAGLAAEQVTRDQNFVDTIDNVGVIGFHGANAVTFVAGEEKPGAIERADLFRASFGAGGPSLQNMTLASCSSPPRTPGSDRACRSTCCIRWGCPTRCSWWAARPRGVLLQHVATRPAASIAGLVASAGPGLQLPLALHLASGTLTLPWPRRSPPPSPRRSCPSPWDGAFPCRTEPAAGAAHPADLAPCGRSPPRSRPRPSDTLVGDGSGRGPDERVGVAHREPLP